MVCSLTEEMWDKKTPVRLLGVGASGTDDEDYDQLCLFGNEERKKQIKVDNAMDAIRKKYGTGAIQRASLLDKNK